MLTVLPILAEGVRAARRAGVAESGLPSDDGGVRVRRGGAQHDRQHQGLVPRQQARRRIGRSRQHWVLLLQQAGGHPGRAVRPFLFEHLGLFLVNFL